MWDGNRHSHLGPDDGAVQAVVADLDGDLSVGKVASDEGRLNFDRDFFPRVQDVSAKIIE